MAEPDRDDADVIGRLLMRVYAIHERVIARGGGGLEGIRDAALLHAVPASRRVVVRLHTRYAESALRYALEDMGTRLLITDRNPGALAKTVERVIRQADDLQLYSSSDPLSNPLCSHDNGGVRIGPRHMR